MNTFCLKNLIQSPDVLCIYMFGSHVYGTATEKSDEDFIVITVDDKLFQSGINLKGDDGDFNFYSREAWEKMCIANHINCLEIDSLPPEFRIKEEQKFDFDIDLVHLRKSISATVSNSWSKCHKKLVVEKDYDPVSAKKSLWQCFRICEMGIQVAKIGHITDYTAMNFLFDEIMNSPNDWEFLKANYQESRNSQLSIFRLLTSDAWLKFKELENE